MNLAKIPAPFVYAGTALVVGVALYFLGRRGLAAAGDAVNPVNEKNVFYSGANAVGEAISGTKDWTLGGAIYDWTH